MRVEGAAAASFTTGMGSERVREAPEASRDCPEGVGEGFMEAVSKAPKRAQEAQEASRDCPEGVGEGFERLFSRFVETTKGKMI